MARFTHTVHFTKIKAEGPLAGLELPGSFRVCSEAQARRDVAALQAKAGVVSAHFEALR